MCHSLLPLRGESTVFKFLLERGTQSEHMKYNSTVILSHSTLCSEQTRHYREMALMWTLFFTDNSRIQSVPTLEVQRLPDTREQRTLQPHFRPGGPAKPPVLCLGCCDNRSPHCRRRLLAPTQFWAEEMPWEAVGGTDERCKNMKLSSMMETQR